MKRTIAAITVATFGFAGVAGTASAASPAKQIAALTKSVKKLQKQVKTLQKQVKTADQRAAAGIDLGFCLLGVTADAFQSTWASVDQALATSVFGPQQTIGDGGRCNLLGVTRQGIRQPPTIAPFSALVALTSRAKTVSARLW